MQLGMCLFCAVANYVWIKTEGHKHYYLALNVNVQGIYSNAVAQICINFLTFWILLSYLVPISLFVTLEIVKFWQARARERGGLRFGSPRASLLAGGQGARVWASVAHGVSLLPCRALSLSTLTPRCVIRRAGSMRAAATPT